MDALAMLTLCASPRRDPNFDYLEDDIDEGTLPTPYASAPSSPRRAFTKEIQEAPLGEVLAAIPFAWELAPGIPKNEPPHVPLVFYETEETMMLQGSSTSSSSSCNSTSDATSTESLSRDSSTTEFEFSSGFMEPAAPAPVPADALFSDGKLIPSLRLPPRLQHLRKSDSSCSDVSSSGSFTSFPSPQSPLHGASKLSSSCGFATTADEEPIVVLGMPERKHCPLSPLRFFHRESFFSSDSSNFFASFSSSSPSSSASPASRASTNAGSPEDSPAERTSALEERLFTDMAMATERRELRKPRQVASKQDLLLKKKLENDQVFGEAALTPQLSRSNARSRPAPGDFHVNSLKKEGVGRAVFSNRLGMLCSCLGILPESP